MTWNELIHQLNKMPESRRHEKAVFIADGTEAWEIDAVNYEDYEGANDLKLTLEENSIWDENLKDLVNPITLSP